MLCSPRKDIVEETRQLQRRNHIIQAAKGKEIESVLISARTMAINKSDTEELMRTNVTAQKIKTKNIGRRNEAVYRMLTNFVVKKPLG